MNDIEHNFVDTVSTERILQWRAAIQEFISVGIAVEFILDHLREVARAIFMRRVQRAIDAIDTRIETLKKEVAKLEGRREHLLSGIGGPSRFGDQTLIFWTPLMMMQFPSFFLLLFCFSFFLLLLHPGHFICFL